MEVQSILIVYIVYFGLAFVQPHDQMVNPFYSVVENNTKKNEIYHEILTQGLAQEWQAFDTMKDELQTARIRNSLRKRNFYKKSSIDENIAAIKREINDGLKQVGKARELPGEEDTFESIRANNKVYVDKSHYLKKLLARENRFIRICRPHRFGKSTFLQMLESFFKGDNKSFFADLSILVGHDWQTHPVIHLDFNIMNVNTLEDFQIDLNRTLMRIGSTYGLQLAEENSVETQLDELIVNLSAKRSQSVVVLVDEYEWPVRRNVEIDDAVESEKCSRFLKKFFAQFKTLVSHVKLLFLTCTMGFDLEDWRLRDGGLRTLDDITLDPEFNGMIGLTEEELTNNFEPHIKAMTNANQTFHTLLETLRRNYNGYCFSRNTSSACRIYNFHSVISCLRHQKVDRYWHRTGNMHFNAIEDFRRQRLIPSSICNRSISTEYLKSTFDYEEPPPVLLCLLLRGYLTFRSYDEKYDEYVVDFPNEEIHETFVKELTETLPAGKLSTKELLEKCTEVRTALTDSKTENFIKLVNQMALGQNYVGEDVEAKQYECTERITRLLQICDITCAHDANYFHNINMDLVIESLDRDQVEYFVFEFAWKKSAGWAMNTLLNFTRIDAFQETFGHESYLIGVNFDPERGLIDEWVKVTHLKKKCTKLEASHSHYLTMYSYMAKNKTCSGLLNE